MYIENVQQTVFVEILNMYIACCSIKLAILPVTTSQVNR